jgi:hypothetical protein
MANDEDQLSTERYIYVGTMFAEKLNGPVEVKRVNETAKQEIKGNDAGFSNRAVDIMQNVLLTPEKSTCIVQSLLFILKLVVFAQYRV